MKYSEVRVYTDQYNNFVVKPGNHFYACTGNNCVVSNKGGNNGKVPMHLIRKTLGKGSNYT